MSIALIRLAPRYHLLPNGDISLQLADAVLDRLLAVMAVRRWDRHDNTGFAHLHPPDGGSYVSYFLSKLKTTNVTPAWPRQPATFSVLTRACGGRRCVSHFASALWCQHTACWTLIGPWAHMPRTPVQPPSCRLPRPRGWYLCTHIARTGACTNLYSQQCEDSCLPLIHTWSWTTKQLFVVWHTVRRSLISKGRLIAVTGYWSALTNLYIIFFNFKYKTLIISLRNTCRKY